MMEIELFNIYWRITIYLIEEVSKPSNEFEIIPVYGEPLMLKDTLGALMLIHFTGQVTILTFIYQVINYLEQNYLQ